MWRLNLTKIKIKSKFPSFQKMQPWLLICRRRYLFFLFLSIKVFFLYNAFIYTNMEDLVIGFSLDCHQCCLERSNSAFDEEPHLQDHNIKTVKAFQKKISQALGNCEELITSQKKKFRAIVEETVEKLRQVESSLFSEFEDLQYIFALLTNTQDQQKKIQILKKIQTKQYKDVTCHQIAIVYPSLDTKKPQANKQMEIKKQSQRLINEGKGKVADIVRDMFGIQQKLKQPFNVDQSTIHQKIEETQSFYTMFSKPQQQSVSIDFTGATTNKNDDIEKNFKKIQQIFKEEETVNMKKKGSTIGTIDTSPSNLRKQSKESLNEKNDPISQSSENVEEINEKLNQRILDSEDEEEVVNCSYAKVEQLRKDQFIQDKKSFKIRLKILKFILVRHISKLKKKRFRVPKQTQKHRFTKIKFIGGDETGTVACFVNWNPFMKQGAVVELNCCEMDLFLKQSYEITSDFKVKEVQSKIKIINQENSISELQNKQENLYTIQKYDKRYPTLRGLIDLNYNEKGEKTHLNFIVKVAFCFEDVISYQLSIVDYTGCTSAKLSKNLDFQLMETQVLYLKNFRVKKEIIDGNTNITVDNIGINESEVILVNNFDYQTFCEKDIHEFIKK